MTPTEAVTKAAKIIGSQSALAARIGVKPPTVNQWAAGERPVPPARAIAIEKATTGGVTRHQLCPDFPWDEPEENKSAA